MISNQRGLKTVFYGGTVVGKSTIINRLRSGIFLEGLPCTIGISFLRIHHNNKTYDLWDTAGQSRFYSLSPMYFRNAHIEVFVFDVSDEDTLYVMNHYEKYLKGMDRSQIIIVGNKIDILSGDQKNVSKEKIMELETNARNKIEAMGFSDRVYDYAWISAKTGQGMEDFLKKLDAYAQTIELVQSESQKDILQSRNDQPSYRICC